MGPSAGAADAADAAGAGSHPLLLIEGLHKRFLHEGKEIHVLRGIDLRVDAGEMVSIVGASGVGKSTFIQVIGTLDRPSEGRVVFEGVDVFELPPAKLASFRNDAIGFVFQFHHLLPEFTALENVMMPALIRRMNRSEADRLAREVLDDVGLSHRLTHKPGELSGGEQQRVALARALVMRPRLILADEPTGNLDPATGEGIHDLLFRLNKEHRITVMVVTHNLELAERMPRTLRMVEGRILEEGGAARREQRGAAAVGVAGEESGEATGVARIAAGASNG